MGPETVGLSWGLLEHVPTAQWNQDTRLYSIRKARPVHLAPLIIHLYWTHKGADQCPLCWKTLALLVKVAAFEPSDTHRRRKSYSEFIQISCWCLCNNFLNTCKQNMPKISRSYWIFWYIFLIRASDNEWIILITSCKTLIFNLTSASYWFPWADDITKASTILLAREQRPWAPSHSCLILIPLPSESVIPGASARLDAAVGLILVHSGGRARKWLAFSLDT